MVFWVVLVNSSTHLFVGGGLDYIHFAQGFVIRALLLIVSSGMYSVTLY
jgi:hypothetical protein